MLGRVIGLLTALFFAVLGAWYLRNAPKYQNQTLQAIAHRQGIWKLVSRDWAARLVQRPWFLRQARVTGFVAVGLSVLLLLLVVLSVIAEGWNPQ